MNKDSGKEKFTVAKSGKSARSGKSAKSSFDRMHLDEIREKARTFRNLNRDREYALRRILQNLEWEFEHSGAPSFAKEVEGVVNDVYGDPRR